MPSCSSGAAFDGTPSHAENCHTDMSKPSPRRWKRHSPSARRPRWRVPLAALEPARRWEPRSLRRGHQGGPRRSDTTSASSACGTAARGCPGRGVRQRPRVLRLPRGESHIEGCENAPSNPRYPFGQYQADRRRCGKSESLTRPSPLQKRESRKASNMAPGGNEHPRMLAIRRNEFCRSLDEIQASMGPLSQLASSCRPGSLKRRMKSPRSRKTTTPTPTPKAISVF